MSAAWRPPDAASFEQILATIRALESGGDILVRAAGSMASGAYQFVDGTWAGSGGYPTATDAPPEVQDDEAAEFVGGILDRHGHVDAVPIVWHLGHLSAPDSPAMALDLGPS